MNLDKEVRGSHHLWPLSSFNRNLNSKKNIKFKNRGPGDLEVKHRHTHTTHKERQPSINESSPPVYTTTAPTFTT